SRNAVAFPLAVRKRTSGIPAMVTDRGFEVILFDSEAIYQASIIFTGELSPRMGAIDNYHCIASEISTPRNVIPVANRFSRINNTSNIFSEEGKNERFVLVYPHHGVFCSSMSNDIGSSEAIGRGSVPLR